MKKLLLYFLLFFSLNLSFGQSYSYVPFPTKSAVWWQFFESSISNPNSSCFTQKFLITSDTVIGSYTYHKLHLTSSSNAGINGCAPPGNATISQLNYGAFRNDTANKKVWLRRFQYSGSQDTLLYDFDLNLGDTLGSTLLIDSSWFMEVVRVDTISLGGVLRKRFVLGNSYCSDSLQVLIEGIGSTAGLTLSPYAPWCLNGTATLECMADSVKTIYPDTTTVCQLVTQLSESTYERNPLLVFPNPTKGQISISAVENLERIIIYNIQGQKVQELSPNKVGATQVNLEGQSGIYLIQLLKNDGNIESVKLIKQ